MKNYWPEKILITSEEVYKKFEEDAKFYLEKNEIHCTIEKPKEFPCVVTSVSYEHKCQDHNCNWTETRMKLVYVYVKDFE